MPSQIISEEERSWLLSIPDVLQYYEFLKNQDKEELALQLAKLMAALDRVDDETRYLITSMFRPFRVIQRNYTGRMGLLWKLQFKVEAIYLLEDAEWEEYSKGTIIREKRVAKFTTSYIMGYEEILFKEERPKGEE